MLCPADDGLNDLSFAAYESGSSRGRVVDLPHGLLPLLVLLHEQTGARDDDDVDNVDDVDDVDNVDNDDDDVHNVDNDDDVDDDDDDMDDDSDEWVGEKVKYRARVT